MNKFNLHSEERFNNDIQNNDLMNLISPKLGFASGVLLKSADEL